MRFAITWRRFLSQAALVLLVHAIAIDTLHHHGFGSSCHVRTAMTAHVDHDGASGDSSGGCPACQLQHNSAAVVPRAVEAFAVETSSIVLPTERLQTILRAGDTSPPDRAPPVL